MELEVDTAREALTLNGYRISFDLVVAAYIAIAYGLIGGRSLGFRDVAT